jgi:hypothetical protein
MIIDKREHTFMTLSNRTKSRISSFFLFISFGAGILAIQQIAPGLRLDPFTWLLLVFASTLGGAAIAYLAIGDFIRWPLTKEVTHSSNSSMIEIEPKYEGWLNSPGALICCPVCAGTWVGVGLLALLAINYSLGYYAILALSVGGAGRIVVRLAELIEWQARYAQERTAALNRKNAREEAEKDLQPFYQVMDGKIYRVTREQKQEIDE